MASLYQLMPYEREALVEFIREVAGYIHDNDGPESYLDAADECLLILGEGSNETNNRDN